MRAAGLLGVLLLALRTTAFNLDTAHPLVWSDQAWNFGYKVDIRDHSGELSLLVAAPKVIPVTNRNLCMTGDCFTCTLRDNQTCTPLYADFPEITFSTTTGIPFKVPWSSYEVNINLVPLQRGFKVVFNGNPISEWMIERQEGEMPWNIYDRAWCSLDLDGNGYKDWVFGSPLYSQHRSRHGRVYAYISRRGNDSVSQMQTIEGRGRAAQFGRSVSCIGDIDNDGFEDLAVGAPGEDGGRGTIYIYHGSRAGLQYSQRISAAQVDTQQHISGFGVFITEGKDVDGNGYKDVAVGASDSRHVVLLRARPVLRLYATLTSNVDEICNATLPFSVSYKLSFTAANKQRPIEVEVWLRADPFQCAVVSSTTYQEYDCILYNETITLYANKIQEDTVVLSLKRGVTISPEPLALELHYKMSESSETVAEFCKNCPTVDPTQPTVASLAMKHTIACGNITCRTNLRLHVVLVTTKRQMAAGEVTTVIITTTVESLLDPAYLTTIFLESPPVVHLVTSTAHCRNRSSTVLECDVANPLSSKDGPKSVIIELNMEEVPMPADQLQFNVSVTSAGEEQNEADNFQVISLKEETSATNWIVAVSIIGGVVACVLLVAVAVVLFKRGAFRERRKEPYTTAEVEYVEYAEYAEPCPVGDILSRGNELYREPLDATDNLKLNGLPDAPDSK